MIEALRSLWLIIRLVFWLLVIAGCLLLAHWLSDPRAFATWRPEYAQLPAGVQAWYENAELTPAAQKRLGFLGCCKSSDVVAAKFAVSKIDGADQWFYQRPGQPWRQVPPDIIHWNEHAPDNRPTLFALSHETFGWPAGTETCFYPPGGAT
jgi:hypothetical protein